MSAIAYAIASVPIAILLALILKHFQIGESTNFTALLLHSLGIGCVWGDQRAFCRRSSAEVPGAAKPEVKLSPPMENSWSLPTAEP